MILTLMVTGCGAKAEAEKIIEDSQKEMDVAEYLDLLKEAAQ